MPDEAVQVLGADTVAPRAQIDHRQAPVVDEAVGLPLADAEPFGGLGDGEEVHSV